MSNTLCAYPWHGVAIRPNGTQLPCCMFQGVPDWDKIRQQQLAGEHVHGCSACYNDEANGVSSLRQNSFKRMPTPIDSTPGNLLFLELAFSNLCDTACMHCGPKYSTRWGNGRVSHEFNANSIDVSKVKYLKVIGGEPMLEQDKFSDLLDKIDVTNLSMQICTNGRTLPNKRLLKHINRSKATLIVVSMDGMEGINDWFRWPSKWEHLEKQFAEYDKLAGDNVFLHFHCCINVYNIFYLKDIIDYVLQNWPNWKIEWDWVNHPKWQSISVLPDNVKQELKHELTEYAKDYTDLTRLCDVNPFTSSASRLDTINTNWNECVKNTNKFANERNLILHDLVPKFAKLL
jgi:sulfatase maturation enzyme AslB (radical SAM superfamily)